MKLWVKTVGSVTVKASVSHVKIIDQARVDSTEWKEYDIPLGADNFVLKTWWSKQTKAVLVKSNYEWDLWTKDGCPEGDLSSDADDEGCANVKRGFISNVKYYTGRWAKRYGGNFNFQLRTDDQGNPIKADDTFWYSPSPEELYYVEEPSHYGLHFLALIGVISTSYLLLKLLTRVFPVNDYKPIQSQVELEEQTNIRDESTSLTSS